MLKINLTKYPLTIERVDRLIIYMVFHQILTIDDLMLRPIEELALLGGWTEEIKDSIEVIRTHYPLD